MTKCVGDKYGILVTIPNTCIMMIEIGHQHNVTYIEVFSKLGYNLSKCQGTIRVWVKLHVG